MELRARALRVRLVRRVCTVPTCVHRTVYTHALDVCVMVHASDINMVFQNVFNECLFVAIRDKKVPDIDRMPHPGILTANATPVLHYTKRPNPNVKGELSALTAAIPIRHWECAMLLLQRGADVNYQRPLSLAKNAKLDTKHTRYTGPARV